jgi:hypothetical protein
MDLKTLLEYRDVKIYYQDNAGPSTRVLFENRTAADISSRHFQSNLSVGASKRVLVRQSSLPIDSFFSGIFREVRAGKIVPRGCIEKVKP